MGRSIGWLLLGFACDSGLRVSVGDPWLTAFVLRLESGKSVFFKRFFHREIVGAVVRSVFMIWL